MTVRAGLVVTLLVALAAPRASAQDPRLVDRLGAPAADSIAHMVARAGAEGIPTAPLMAKAQQGAARGIPAPLVLKAVVNLADALRSARIALGAGRTTDELTAGAAALQNGADQSLLRRIAGATGTRTVTMPLVILTDLLARGVPGDTLASMLANAARRGVPDDELLRMRETISRDIASGRLPLDAATARISSIPSPSAPRPPVAPTGESPRP